MATVHFETGGHFGQVDFLVVGGFGLRERDEAVLAAGVQVRAGGLQQDGEQVLRACNQLETLNKLAPGRGRQLARLDLLCRIQLCFGA